MPDAYAAMEFARHVHRDQVRKYTGAPYAEHLAEVAGIAATVAQRGTENHVLAVAWLHDCVEDHGVTYAQLADRFGHMVAEGVMMLSDLEAGNRATRKVLSAERLSKAEGWIQTIKCADLISNTTSIVKHDPKFAEVYLAETRFLLRHLHLADRRLWIGASALAEAARTSNQQTGL